MRKWFERLLLLIGICGIGIWGLSRISSTAFQYWANRILERNDNAKTAEERPDAPKEPRRVTDGELLGRLEIPRLHVQSVVREGVGNMTLSLAVGHLPGTALPGQNGNMAIAGHRDTFFRGLREVGKKDLIRFNTRNNSYLYEVESMQIVSPDDVQVLRASANQHELTLITCYPFNYVGSAPERYIVKAREVAEIFGGGSAAKKTPTGIDE